MQNLRSYKPATAIPDQYRKMFQWLARSCGMRVQTGGPPVFERGLKIGGILITEKELKSLLTLREELAGEGAGDLFPEKKKLRGHSAK
jgi:hypothetical protein